MKAIIAIILSLFMVPSFAMSPQELEDADVIGTAPCHVHGETLTCIVVKKNGQTYAVAGYVKGEDFIARYVGHMTDKGWVTVWIYGKTV